MPRKKRQVIGTRVYVPSSLHKLFISGELGQRELWVVSTLTHHIISMDEDERDTSEYKPLYSKTLHTILTSNYNKYLSPLKEYIIECKLNEDGEESFDSIKHKSKQYRLQKPYRDEVSNDNIEVVELTDWKILKNIDSTLKKKHNELLENNEWIAEELDGLNYLNYDSEASGSFMRKAYKSGYLKNKRLTETRFASLDIHNYNLTKLFQRDRVLTHLSIKNGRLFHPLTYCNKELRQFVTNSFDESVVEIDLKSAQFFFLCQAKAIASKYSYKKNLLEGILKHVYEPINLSSHIDINSAFGAFMEAVIEFDVYSEMSKIKVSTNYELGSEEKDQKHVRDKVKLEFIKKVLYGYHTSYPKNIYEGKKPHELSLLENFYEQYGPVMDFIKKIADECTRRKEDGSYSKSSCLAIILQNLEGFFFHHVVRERLQKEIGGFGYFIVHDAIYVDPDYEENVRTLLVDISTKHFGRRLYFGGTDSSESEYVKMLTLCLTPEKQKELFEDVERHLGEDIELIVSPVNNSWDSFTWDIKKK